MVDSIIAAIDKQIASLQQARDILAVASASPTSPEPLRLGRPKGSTNTPKAKPTQPKHTMSAEGRARISAAMKKRHAAKKRAAK